MANPYRETVGSGCEESTRPSSFLTKLRLLSIAETFALIRQERDAGRLRLEGRAWVHVDGSRIELPDDLDVIQVPEIKTTLEGEGR